jgi:hypothetical protein
MYIDWDSYAVMGIKTMKSFSRPRGELQRVLCVSVAFINVSLLSFKANTDGCEMFCVDCDRIHFAVKGDDCDETM